MAVYISLHDIMPALECDFENYAMFEHDVIEPALRAAGYRPEGRWHTGDGDSYGPLTRCIRTNRGIVVYG